MSPPQPFNMTLEVTGQHLPGSILAKVKRVESFATKQEEKTRAAVFWWRPASSFSRDTWKLLVPEMCICIVFVLSLCCLVASCFILKPNSPLVSGNLPLPPFVWIPTIVIVYPAPDWSHLCSPTSCINSSCLPLSCVSSSCSVWMKVSSNVPAKFSCVRFESVCDNFLILQASVLLCLYFDPHCECFLLLLNFHQVKFFCYTYYCLRVVHLSPPVLCLRSLHIKYAE